MFRSKILPIIQGNMTMFETLTKEDVTDETLIKLCHRAGSIIMSYGFDLEEETSENEVDEEDWVEDMEGKIMMGLVPLADILNFDAECNVGAWVLASAALPTKMSLGPYQPWR